MISLFLCVSHNRCRKCPAPSEATIFMWFADFSTGHMSTKGDEPSVAVQNKLLRMKTK